MVSLAMLAIMAGCAAYLFLKGTLAQGVAMIFNAIIAGFIAFGFYEMLSEVLIKYSPGIAVWANLICFVLLFILAFAILQTVAMQLNKEKVDFGTLAEQIGRPVAGIVLGYIITGRLLIAVAMAPLPSQWPYPRFDERNPNPASPSKALLSPDGFVAGLFGTVSKGSLSPLGQAKSFAVLHAGYVDQLYLNRQKVTQKVTIVTSAPAIAVPRKDGVWFARDGLRDSEGKALSAPGGESLMLARIAIRRGSLKDAAKFTLSQLRLICRPKTGEGPLSGVGRAVYPIGYIGSGGRLERKSLAEIITIDSAKVEGDVSMDVAFFVPTNLTPALVAFKRNNVVPVSSPASPEDAPQPLPFGASAPPPQAAASPEPRAEPAPAPPASNERRGGSGLSDFSRSIVGDGLEEN